MSGSNYRIRSEPISDRVEREARRLLELEGIDGPPDYYAAALAVGLVPQAARSVAHGLERRDRRARGFE